MRRALFLCCMLFTASVLHAQTKNFIDQPYVEVNGHADTSVTPDEIFIRINISEKDTKNKVSLEELENKMIDALKSLGIDVEKDMVINDMTSNFKVYLLKAKDIFKSKQYTLKLSNAETAGKVFIELEDIGISNTSIDHVDLSNRDFIRREVLSKAIKDANDNAIALTNPLNQKLGKAIQISSISPMNSMNGLRSNLSEIVVTGYGKRSPINHEPAPNISFEKIKISSGSSQVYP